MRVYDYPSFKILLFDKKAIFYLSENSRFIIYLNKDFEYKQRYRPEDITAVQLLRDDLFPVHILTVENRNKNTF